MRTEDDLRAALTALERYAPAAARVLPGAPSPMRHGLRSPRTIGWVAGIATAAAVAGAVTALTLPGGATGTEHRAAAPSTKATLQAKVLAAFSTTSHEIVYMHGTYSTEGTKGATTEETWDYPWQASTGQPVRARSLTINPVVGRSDVGVSYLMPAPGKDTGPLPTVPGEVQTKGEKISVDYTTKTWYQAKNSPLFSDPPDNPALIAADLKSKQWTAHSTTLNGRATIELTLKDRILKGQATVNSWTEYLWVDASTYLPLRDLTTFGPPGMVTNADEEYQYLPATSANLARLTPPIPAGFKRVAPLIPQVGLATPGKPASSPAPVPVKTSSR